MPNFLKVAGLLRRVSARGLFSVFVLLTFVLGLCLIDADAQSRRRRRTRRARPVVKRPVITNPTITSPANMQDGDVKIISTADETVDGSQEPDSGQTKKPKSVKPTSDQDMQTTITSLTNQINRLNDRLSQMQQDDRYMLEMERLTRAEQRAEQLRTQLFDVQSKLADLGSRLEQVEYMSKPENIEKSMSAFGSVRPEDAREARKRQLDNEKGRLQAQINILETSRTRLEQAITTADEEVDLLRARLNQKKLDQASQPEAAPAAPRKP